MGTINWHRVALGGLVWVAVNGVLGAAAYGLYLMQVARDAFERAGLRVVSHMTSPTFLAFVLALSFVSGVIAIWLYAAIRPRYGPGPRTAAIAAIAAWTLAQCLPLLYLSQLVGLSTRLVLVNGVTTLIVGLTATMAGASLYKE